MAKILNVKEFENEVINGSGVTLVDFYAEWCGPCKMIAPILEELSSEMYGKANVVKVDIDKMPELAHVYEVMAVPTLIIFKNGKPMEKVMGFQPKGILKDKLNYYAG